MPTRVDVCRRAGRVLTGRRVVANHVISFVCSLLAARAPLAASAITNFMKFDMVASASQLLCRSQLGLRGRAGPNAVRGDGLPAVNGPQRIGVLVGDGDAAGGCDALLAHLQAGPPDNRHCKRYWGDNSRPRRSRPTDTAAWSRDNSWCRRLLICTTDRPASALGPALHKGCRWPLMPQVREGTSAWCPSPWGRVTRDEIHLSS